MKWLLYLVVIPAILFIWQVLWERDKEKERNELVRAIRAELKEVRDDILKRDQVTVGFSSLRWVRKFLQQPTHHCVSRSS